MNPPGKAHPAEPPRFEITDLSWSEHDPLNGEGDVDEFFYENADMESVEQYCLEHCN